MNIIVKTNGSGLCHCRPDTTWERENKDFYAPDCVNEVHWAPVMFARICKAGKCVGEKFASRYYDAVGFGALLYIGDFMPDRAAASCADHTSLLPLPLYNPVVIENVENAYEVLKNGEEIYTYASADAGLVVQAVCEASRLTSLRIGDFVAVELEQPKPLASRSEGGIALKATYCENELYDMKIIF